MKDKHHIVKNRYTSVFCSNNIWSRMGISQSSNLQQLSLGTSRFPILVGEGTDRRIRPTQTNGAHKYNNLIKVSATSLTFFLFYCLTIWNLNVAVFWIICILTRCLNCEKNAHKYFCASCQDQSFAAVCKLLH